MSYILEFLDLVDTPDTFSSQAGKPVAVKADETGIEFVTGVNADAIDGKTVSAASPSDGQVLIYDDVTHDAWENATPPWLRKDGDTMTAGDLTLYQNPSNNMHAANKKWIEDNFSASSHAHDSTYLKIDASNDPVTGDLSWNNAAGPAILNEAATATNPTLNPNKADADTGIGWNSANILSLIAGAAEILTVESGLVTAIDSDFLLDNTQMFQARESDVPGKNLWSNADLEAGIDDWNADAACTISSSTEQAWEGTKSLKVSPTSEWWSVISDAKAVEASTAYTVSLYVYYTSDIANDYLYIYDQDDNQITATALTVSATTWTRVHIHFTTETGDTGIKVSLDGQSQNNIYVDGIQLELGSSETTWENYGTVNPGVIRDLLGVTSLDVIQLGNASSALDIAATQVLVASDVAWVGSAGAAPTILNESPGETTPVILPNKADVDTGIGWKEADALTIIAGGINVATFSDANSGQIEALHFVGKLKASGDDFYTGDSALYFANDYPVIWSSDGDYYGTPDLGFTRYNNGSVTMLKVTDGSTGLGRILVSGGSNAVPGLAFGDGDSGLWESSDDLIYFCTNGTGRAYWNNNAFASGNTYGLYIPFAASSSTAPTYAFESDTTTGMGRGAAGAITLTCAGTEIVRVANGTVTVTSSDILLSNTKKLQAKEAGGTVRDLVTFDSNNIAIFGNGANWTYINGDYIYANADVRISAGDAIQLQNASETWLDALSVTSSVLYLGSSFSSIVIDDPISASVVLNNAVAIQGKETGGTARNLINMNSSDDVEVGNTTNTLVLKSASPGSFESSMAFASTKFLSFSNGYIYADTGSLMETIIQFGLSRLSIGNSPWETYLTNGAALSNNLALKGYNAAESTAYNLALVNASNEVELGSSSLNLNLMGAQIDAIPALANTVYLRAEESGGTARNIIGTDSSNDVQVGNTSDTLDLNCTDFVTLDNMGELRVGDISGGNFTDINGTTGTIDQDGTAFIINDTRISTPEHRGKLWRTTKLKSLTDAGSYNLLQWDSATTQSAGFMVVYEVEVEYTQLSVTHYLIETGSICCSMVNKSATVTVGVGTKFGNVQANTGTGAMTVTFGSGSGSNYGRLTINCDLTTGTWVAGEVRYCVVNTDTDDNDLSLF